MAMAAVGAAAIAPYISHAAMETCRFVIDLRPDRQNRYPLSRNTLRRLRTGAAEPWVNRLPARTVIPGASRVLQKPFACQPCYKRDCPLKHHRCMSEITVEDVFNAAIGLFNEIDGKVEEAADGEVRVL